MKANRIFRLFYILIFLNIFLFSCVPAGKFEALKAKRDDCEKENSSLKDENRKLTSSANEYDSKVSVLNKQIASLKADTSSLGSNMRKMAANYNQLSQTYNLLMDKEKELLEGGASESKKILTQLQKQQESLQQQEDKLLELNKNLDEKKKILQSMEDELAVSKKELNEKQARLIELQNILNRKDSTVKALKDKVSAALLSFQNNGLTIEQKNGKVYVSMDEKLLFKPAKYEVDTKGVEALKKLSKVLEANADVNIMVEGNTDNVEYNGKNQIKDNWDLSVMRATSVVKIILENSSINPIRLSAVGRSQYQPLDPANTPEARSKNRRTDIILTPKLDELFKIIESN